MSKVLFAAILMVAGHAAGDEVRQRIEKAAPHPRLFWPADGEEAVRAKIKQDPQCAATWKAVQRAADQMLGEPPVVYVKQGRRLLHRSREALGRIIHLGFAARMTGDKRYIGRAVAEMKAAAAMPDWNPSHFLDTAEMTLALAVGYDWLHAVLSPAERAEIKAAIETKGLGPYLKPKSKHGWERGGNNWNQVCHGGMVAGALALLEDNPERAVEVVSRALKGLPHAMKVYDPDGTYPEGPSYWAYGTTYNVVLIAMLESALGADFGLTQHPGFLKSGEFPLHMTGPTGNHYCFSDCGVRTVFSPAMVWFATRTKRPDLLWFQEMLLQREVRETQHDRFFPLALIWAAPNMNRIEPATRNWYGRGPNPLAVFRTSWTDPNALYLAIKAGSPGASHGHMDIGSFIMEADGVRWSLDLGMQSYHALESRGFNLWNGRQGGDRWKLFRYHTRGHSTLMVDDQEQVVNSRAPITEFSSEQMFAVVDMSATYAKQLAGATRKFSVESNRRVVIEDKLKGGAKPVNVRWAIITPGTLKPGGWLEKDGKRLRIEVIAPKGAKLQSWPADPPPNDFDEPNPGVNVVGFIAPLAAGVEATWRVALSRPGG
ncbi:MAG: heparinase [Verrucomicrobia bacterium]|nr:heparinase [Verrucomicrobiota bacterium]